MIVWGSGGDVVHLGALGEQPCEQCGLSRPFSVVLNYRYFGFYWFFNCVTERNFVVTCDVCQHGWKLNPREFQGEMPPARIPFMRRYGLAVLLAAFFAIFALAEFNGN
jgi:hypothetical protein